ncbi:hypothetical protein [Pedobacter cryophilus]|uniref:hypothetical protein n=1 Tax=Pedobacter cryophilus TaxID=2571271 RepID=UPI00145F6C84|nr:hypothetical protein [Pedobacter cryophilus]
MIKKGRLISRNYAANYFNCTPETIGKWINELKEEGHLIKYSRSLQKYCYENPKED